MLDAEVKYVSVPLWDGKAGFMAESAPLVGKVGYGRLRVDLPDGSWKTYRDIYNTNLAPATSEGEGS